MLLITGFVTAMTVGLNARADRATSEPSAAQKSPAVSAAPRVSDSPATGPADGATAADDFRPQAPARAWDSIVLHHSATAMGDVASIDMVHRQQKDRQGRAWLGIGYHFVIGNGRQMGDGEIEPTFRWRKQLAGAHAGNRANNERGIGICLIGNFDETAPTNKQLAAARELVKTLSERYSITRERIVRHQDVQATACPGRRFPWQEVMRDVPLPADDP